MGHPTVPAIARNAAAEIRPATPCSLRSASADKTRCAVSSRRASNELV